jgi:hypothetical protein
MSFKNLITSSTSIKTSICFSKICTNPSANSGTNTGTRTIQVSNCYSTGSISDFGGGIFGSNTAQNISGGTVYASNCYSTGTIIGYNGGGIFGNNTAYQALGNALTCKAYYCYVIGGNVIFGGQSNTNTTYTSLSYCIWFGANGKTSDITSTTYQTQGSTWIDANAQLTINQTNSSVTPNIVPNWVIFNNNTYKNF